jgi:hypothetical protein
MINFTNEAKTDVGVPGPRVTDSIDGSGLCASASPLVNSRGNALAKARVCRASASWSEDQRISDAKSGCG